MVDFIRKATKKSLLAMLKRVDQMTGRDWARLFEGVLFKDEFESFASGGGLDHGAMGGLADDDHTRYLDKDGTRALTGNWDVGSYEIKSRTFQSDVSTGTAPFIVSSTTKVTNLNADLLDGQSGAYYLDSDNFTGTEWTDLTDGGETALHIHDARYYTETELDAGQLDNRYYTESEIDASLALYLPLTAEVTYPLSGNLYIQKTSKPTLWLQENAVANDYFFIQDNGTIGAISKVTASGGGSATVRSDPRPLDGSSDAFYELFRQTNTTGTRKLTLFLGDNTATDQHTFNAGTGDVDLCQQGGQLTVGGTGGAEKLSVIGDASLTGDLYVDTAHSSGISPSVNLRPGGSATNFSRIIGETDVGVWGLVTLENVQAAGGSYIGLEPTPSDGTSVATFRMFRFTNTTGTREYIIFQGDGSATRAHDFNAGTGDANLSQQGGQTTIGGTGGAEKLTVVGTGSFGDGGTTNYTDFEADGTIHFNGTATVWEDLRVPALATRVPATAGPTFAQWKDDGSSSVGVFLYWFDPSTDNSVYFTAQMPHSWKEGSDIEPHVHWTPADTAPGSGTDVCWGLEYLWVDKNEVAAANTTIIYADEQSEGSGETITYGKHYYTDFADITGTGHTISSMLVCRLFRDATSTGGTDDYDDDAGFLEFDFHYEIDTVGSRTEGTK